MLWLMDVKRNHGVTRKYENKEWLIDIPQDIPQVDNDDDNGSDEESGSSSDDHSRGWNECPNDAMNGMGRMWENVKKLRHSWILCVCSSLSISWKLVRLSIYYQQNDVNNDYFAILFLK